MHIYLLRHGIAAERDPDEYPDDAERPLTARGIEKLRRSLDQLKNLEVECQRILSSPFRRAWQTAELAARKIGAPLEVCPELCPGGSFQGFPWTTLQGDTMLVGHEPDLSRLGSWLMTGSDWPIFELKKAGVACLERGDSGYRLLWLLPPRLLAK